MNGEAELDTKLGKGKICEIALWATECPENKERLFGLLYSTEDRIGYNALWCIASLPPAENGWLQSKQQELIDVLLHETHTGKRRLLLHILRKQEFAADALRVNFLDFCFGKINSECEPYAIRAFCIHCAFKMCRHYPELIAELEEYLNLLSTQSLSPGLQSALRSTRKNINSAKCKLHATCAAVSDSYKANSW